MPFELTRVSYIRTMIDGKEFQKLLDYAIIFFK